MPSLRRRDGHDFLDAQKFEAQLALGAYIELVHQARGFVPDIDESLQSGRGAIQIAVFFGGQGLLLMGRERLPECRRGTNRQSEKHSS
ncbi:hypothetical protein [Bradyrhizobium sp. 15]|uniref:hypothetical protein n=1 Tax=Bradyrhizobium sp. 15 TaxID=2782633 RepID=UPI001FFB88A8|nr:hypothetical protein [Bradyrhizobium sp. 15]MCK1440432.1 hypothetical protein [Bradyrhizobium sp. 15]